MSLHVPVFDNVRVLVIGDVMLDHDWYGDTSRISPEAPVPVVRVRGTEKRPGGAANVAMNVAAVGAHSMLAGLVGEDDSATALERLLAAASVHSQLVHVPGIETITKMRILSRHQQLLRLDIEEPLPVEAARSLVRDSAQRLHGVHALVLSDYGKGTLGDVSALIGKAREMYVPVLVDPKGTDFERYRGATLVTPNQAELEQVVGACADTETLVRRAQELRRSLSLGALLVTRGEYGMTLISADAPVLHLRAEAREVFDVTGAGDTVIGVLAAAVGAGQSIADAARLANAAAGLVVGKLGAATASAEELRIALADAEPAHPELMHEDQVLALIKAARAHGERVVMTNGCFDLLHAGHVQYLRQARALGERLLIAVNDDDSVRRLKGAYRPVNDVHARAKVLAALSAVDWVVPFSEDTPSRLIERLAPDVLVKGGDYTVDQIAGGDSVRKRGGSVVVLPFVQGFSTSSMLERSNRGTTR
ncbi:MAG: D-beta-D-heptose 7-phosphate kinase/D-beta-D-heptose 1-phosphate adenosyltransferase [Gammaproteobacteria bacterium]|jgi:D-beta-D-heptose 7-phosphate kinase/D-beta-D-heptose 1-phosphate adenosyltransferase